MTPYRIDPLKVSTVITDLDNTLFDWVEFWYTSFTALMNELHRETGIPMQVLLDDARAVHQRHGTSEYYFVIAELNSLKDMYPGVDLMRRFSGPMTAYRAARDASLRLYPTVLETLMYFKQARVMTIGYTESTAFYTGWRMRRLGLDGLLTFLHSPEDHELPASIDLEAVRNHPAEHYELNCTVHHHTPAGERKPNPRLLRDIISDVGADPSECLYVGDSLMKDVLMAQEAGIADVHAAYGVAQERSAYDLLRRVTHWTDEDVERERRLYDRGQVTPAVVLDRTFGQLREHFAFAPATYHAGRWPTHS